MYLHVEACEHIVSAVPDRPHTKVFPGEECLGQHLYPKRLAALGSHCDLAKENGITG